MTPTAPAALEHAERLDRAAELVDRLAATLVPEGPVRRTLRGSWLGHPLHPLLTDLPIGFWTSGSLLDLVGGIGARRAATALIGLGVASAVPTVASGLAEFTTLDQPRRRVAVVHLAANAVATALYARSWITRRRGQHGAGARLALFGAGAATVGGYLGGHLAFASTNRDDTAAQVEPGSVVDAE